MKQSELSQRLQTLCVRAGQGTQDGEPLVTPIVQSTTFCRDGLESQAKHCYSRESNPTVDALELVLGELEEAPQAVAYSTGLAAETGLFIALLRAGDHVIVSRALYGGTTRLCEQVLSGLGITASFVDTTKLADVRGALRANTRLIFAETPSNPTLDVTDLRGLSRIANAAGAYLAVDNTFLTPILQQPLELGADFSVYSTTKFIEGHSVALGGCVISRDEEALERLRFVRKCIGNIQTPFNAWLTLNGLKTLPLRMERQSCSAESLAQKLFEHEATERVLYPTVPGFVQAELAQEQHLGGHGAVISFVLRGGYERARCLLREVKLCRVVEHVGAVETLLTHSASMTHGGVAPAERAAVGVSEGLVRISVGLEHPDAIWADLKQAIEKAVKSAPQEAVACAQEN
ncbi:MAG: cystathionine beta-lyase/cystathionine gamma-synthase [Planctomycetota bacterium]|jgi:cystathionine beta-lyase/cystathionine gamma-synthase